MGGSSPAVVVVAVEGEGGDGEELTGMTGMGTSDLRRLQPSRVSPSPKNEFMRWNFTLAKNPSMQPSCLQSIQPRFRAAKILQAARSVFAVGNYGMWNPGSLFAVRRSFNGCKCSMRFRSWSLLHSWLYVTQSAIVATMCRQFLRSRWRCDRGGRCNYHHDQLKWAPRKSILKRAPTGT